MARPDTRPHPVSGIVLDLRGLMMVSSQKEFKVIDQIRVRSAPSLQGNHVAWLATGTVLRVDAGSRTEADGYVWWRHSDGWSAECTLDSAERYMEETETVVQDNAGAESSDTNITFQVGERQVRVRRGPSLSDAHVTWLNPGQAIRVEPGSRTEADGFVWWQHGVGWSVERSLDGAQVYLTRVTVKPTGPLSPLPEESAPPAVEEPAASPAPDSAAGSDRVVFKVGPQQVRIRKDPTFSGQHVGWLNPDELVEMQPDSRTEFGGYVWWRHNKGWSVERKLDGLKVYLTHEEAAPAPAETPPAEAPETPIFVPASPTPAEPSEETRFIVGRQQVRVRRGPSLQASHVRWLMPGEEVIVKVDSRTEANGYIWYEHNDGWSVQRSIDGTVQFLFDPEEFANRPDQQGPVFREGLPDVDTIPMRDAMFSRLPLELSQTQWWQYFGNNVFSYNLWARGMKWYSYAQGLHGGVDFGNSVASAPIVAGVTGVFVKRDVNYTKPNGMWVKVGDYTVIYGHLANPANLTPGAAIAPDTVLGTIDLGGQNHLHLEIRYKGRWIVNPLLFMPEDMRNSLIGKFPPSEEYFYKDAAWTQWQTPLDQPVLVLGGDLIGPHA